MRNRGAARCTCTGDTVVDVAYSPSIDTRMASFAGARRTPRNRASPHHSAEHVTLLAFYGPHKEADAIRCLRWCTEHLAERSDAWIWLGDFNAVAAAADSAGAARVLGPRDHLLAELVGEAGSRAPGGVSAIARVQLENRNLGRNRVKLSLKMKIPAKIALLKTKLRG